MFILQFLLFTELSAFEVRKVLSINEYIANNPCVRGAYSLRRSFFDLVYLDIKWLFSQPGVVTQREVNGTAGR